MQCRALQSSAVQSVDVKIELTDYLELATCTHPSNYLYGCISACVCVCVFGRVRMCATAMTCHIIDPYPPLIGKLTYCPFLLFLLSSLTCFRESLREKRLADVRFFLTSDLTSPQHLSLFVPFHS